MYSRFLSVAALTLVLLFSLSTSANTSALTVCADPENLPFSNEREQGFENKLARLLGRNLHRPIKYLWMRHTGRGFVRNVLNENECDVLLGVPNKFDPVLTTSPYYSSSYVFVSRTHKVEGFDDPWLRGRKIGVQVVEEEFAPPAIALGRRGLVADIVPYEAIGPDSGNIIRAVAKGNVDVAVVWGPLAGYYARLYQNLQITPTPNLDPPALPLRFSISMGVRKKDTELRDAIERVLQSRRTEVRAILDSFGVIQSPQDIR
jgi:mxaJ protein